MKSVSNFQFSIRQNYHFIFEKFAAGKGDLSAPYYRIIFELLDRLCQIIEKPGDYDAN